MKKINKGKIKELFFDLRYRLAYMIFPEIFDDFDDMEERLSGLLDHVTGGLLSKTNYTLQTMISSANDYQQRCCDECEYYLAANQTEKEGEENDR